MAIAALVANLLWGLVTTATGLGEVSNMEGHQKGGWVIGDAQDLGASEWGEVKTGRHTNIIVHFYHISRCGVKLYARSRSKLKPLDMVWCRCSDANGDRI